MVAPVAGMTERFCTMLDCVDVGFVSDGVLDELPHPSRIGSTRVGGIDLNKPRDSTALSALLALAVAPHGFTVAGFAAQVRRLTASSEAGYSTCRAAYDLRQLRGKALVTMPAGTRRYSSGLRPRAPSPPS